MSELLSVSAVHKLRRPAVERLVVAVSGGVDSAALLHAVSKLGVRVQIQGLHIHHGLVGNADQLAEAAQRNCDACHVPLDILSVEVVLDGSVEAEARKSRYAAFREFLTTGDLLLLAHHADDQVETALFQMFRGSRVMGLYGMPEERQVGRARLYRPLLRFRRKKILEYARKNELAWIEDESNADLSADRNYIRHSVLPTVESRWPDIHQRLISGLDRDTRARSILREHQSERLNTVRLQRDCLDLEALRNRPVVELVELLGTWLRDLQVHMPTGKFLKEVASELSSCRLIDARSGQLEIKQHQGRLYALKRLPAVNADECQLSLGEISLVGGVLINASIKGAGLCQDEYYVRFRKGGESLRQRRKRTIKNLCQESGLPAWLRPRIPLIYKGEELVAMAALPSWNFPMQIADGYRAERNEAGFDLALHLNDRF